MSRVATNATNLSVARESSLGVASTTFFQMEPNSYGGFGADITTVPRSFISQNRQRRKGAVTDLDSKAEYECDLTKESLLYWTEAIFFASFYGPTTFRPTAVTTTAYSVPSGGALAAGTLIFARGFAVEGNNGFKVVGAASDSDEIKTSGLAAETTTVPQNATLEICGVQGADSDIEIDGDGLLSSTVLDFTTLGLTVGQFIHIGGATGGALVFANANNRGLVRIRSIAAHLITFDKQTTTFAIDNGASKTIQIFWGQFARQVATTDAKWLERSHTLERLFPDLDGGSDAYEYSVGAFVNEVTLNFPLANKATMNMSLLGIDTDPPTTSRLSGGSAPILPVQTAPFNTSADMVRMRLVDIDDAGISSDFKNLSVKYKNNLTPDKVLGTLGAARVNVGQCEVDMEMSVVLTDPAVMAAVRNNTTCSMDVACRNADGAFVFDMPSVTLGGGGLDFPTNEAVLVNLTAMAFQDTFFGYSTSMSYFPYLPD